MMNVFGWIFSGVFLLFAALAVLIGLMRGKKYKWTYSLARLTVVILSVICSVLLSKWLSSVLSKLIYSLIPESGSFGELMHTLPSAEASLALLTAMILVPILFYPVFLILRGLMTLLVKPLTNLFLLFGKKEKQESDEQDKKLSRKERKRKKYGATGPNPLGMVLGAVCSFSVLCAFLFPFTGAMDLIYNTLDEVESIENSIVSDEDDGAVILNTAEEIASGLGYNVGTKTVNILGGKALYGWMTSGVMNGEKVHLKNEVGFLAATASAFTMMSDENADAQSSSAAIRTIPDSMKDSHMIPILAAEFLSAASTEWSQGKDFCGMEPPALGEGMGSLEEELWSSLKGADEATVKEDVRTLLNIVAVFVEHDGMNSLEGDPIELLSNRPMVEKILLEFLKNERLDHMMDVILDLGLETALTKLEVRPSMDGAFDDYISDFTAITEDAGVTDPNTIAKQYENVLDRYGIPHDTAYAEFVLIAGDVVGGTKDASEVAKSFVASQEEMEAKSVLVCLDRVLIEGGVAEDNQKEAALMADVFEKLMTVIQDLDQSDPDMGQLLTDFGPALDSLVATQTVGREKTENFLLAFMQCKSVRENCYFTLVEATDVAKSIVDGSHSEGGFTVMMLSLGKTVSVIDKAANQGGLTMEDLNELLHAMSPEAAKVIDTLSRPGVLEKYGAGGESAQMVADVITDIFTKYADKNVSGELTEEQKQTEAAAITDLMNVMLSGGDKNVETVFGEEGVLGIGADAYVETVLNSEIISDALLDVAYDDNGELVNDPLNIQKSLSEEEKQALVSSANAQFSQLTEEEKQQAEELIYATAAIMNIDNVALINGVWTLIGQ